jgi:hypothetical protein
VSAQAAQSQSAEAKLSTDIPEDLSIPPFLRREQPKPQPPPDARKPNGRILPPHDERAQQDGSAAPQQCGGPVPPAQNADIAAPYRVGRIMMERTPEQRRPVTQADLDEIDAKPAREGIEPVRQPAPAAHIDVTIHDDTMASTPQRAEANTNHPNSPVLEQPVAPQQHKQPAVEQRVGENEDRSVDPETLSIPLVVFPGLYNVIPTCQTTCSGWSAFVDATAPTPAPVAKGNPTCLT